MKEYKITVSEEYEKLVVGWCGIYCDKVELIVPPKVSEEPKRYGKLYSISSESEQLVKETYEEYWPQIQKLIEEAKKNNSLPRTKKPTEDEIKQAIIDSEILRQDYFQLWGLLVNANVYLPNQDEPAHASFRWWGGLLSEIDNQNTDYMSYYCSSDINGLSARQKQLRKTLEGLGWRIIKYKDDGFG